MSLAKSQAPSIMRTSYLQTPGELLRSFAASQKSRSLFKLNFSYEYSIKPTDIEYA